MDVNVSSSAPQAQPSANQSAQPQSDSSSGQENQQKPSANGGQSGKQETQAMNTSDAHAAKVQAEKKAAMLKKYKYKVDGKEIEEEIDLADDEAVAKRLRGSRAVEENLIKSKEAAKKAMDIVKQFDSDPASLLKRLPPDLARKIAEEHLLGHIKQDMLSPEEKEAMSRKEKEEAERRAEREELESYRKRAREEQEYKLAQEFQGTIIEALGKTKLPKSPALIKKMAQKLKKSFSLELPLDANDLVEYVENEELSHIKAYVPEMTAEQIIATFGEEIVNKIRKHDIEKLKAKQSELFQTGSIKQDAHSQNKESRPMSMDEWREQTEKRLKGLA